MLRDMIFPWSDTEFLGIVSQATGIIAGVEPELVMVDPLSAWGIDACHAVGVKAVTLSPVSWSFCVKTIGDKANLKRFLSWPGFVLLLSQPLSCGGNPRDCP